MSSESAPLGSFQGFEVREIDGSVRTLPALKVPPAHWLYWARGKKAKEERVAVAV